MGKLDHRFALRPGDALLAITFAPYSDETLALAQAARDRGLPVVGLTDHLASPMARLSDAALTVPEVDFGAFRSLSATIALALALAVAVGLGAGLSEFRPAREKGFRLGSKWNKNSKTESGWSGSPRRRRGRAGV